MNFPRVTEFCLVCMHRKGLAGGSEFGEPSAFKDMANSSTEQGGQRFEHYELVMSEDGKPVELGRGAMGVTYKAFHVDLHCPVALKVIGERYLGDESVRFRFLREARAAASVRHPNVATVFHLGGTGQNYFYAMEFLKRGNARKSHQRLRPARSNVGAGNRDASGRRFGCGTQVKAGAPRHQAKQHHGEHGGGRRRDRENHRSGTGQARPRLAC